MPLGITAESYTHLIRYTPTHTSFTNKSVLVPSAVLTTPKLIHTSSQLPSSSPDSICTNPTTVIYIPTTSVDSVLAQTSAQHTIQTSTQISHQLTAICSNTHPMQTWSNS